MTVKDRIESTPSGHIIKLTESESKLYTGSGWKIARFIDGQLVELFDLSLGDTLPENRQQGIQQLVNNAVKWASNAEGELWSVICSCDELIGPEPFSPDDSENIAQLQYRLFDDDIFFTME